jgi:saccharopine dehydrogenase-like NADP-dependent oxidoreductase
MRVAVLGAGAVGARAARQLASTPTVTEVVVSDLDTTRADLTVRSIADQTPGRVRTAPVGAWADGADVGLITVPSGDGAHRTLAERLLEQGAHVVSTADDSGDVRALLDLDAEARERGRTVAIGAGFAPGLTDVLAAHAAARFDQVDELHIAKVGTAGPACARQHHRALTGEALDWRDGAWQRRRGGSGRELCWFPDPVGGQDCYRAALPDAWLLHGAFPDAERITARMGATRRDRMTAGLPMLRKPHPEGTVGAVRVELRGRRGGTRDVVIFGAMDRPGVAAGCVAAVTAAWCGEGRAERSGAAGLGELVAPVPFLAELARRGVKAAAFDGVPA